MFEWFCSFVILRFFVIVFLCCGDVVLRLRLYNCYTLLCGLLFVSPAPWRRGSGLGA